MEMNQNVLDQFYNDAGERLARLNSAEVMPLYINDRVTDAYITYEIEDIDEKKGLYRMQTNRFKALINAILGNDYAQLVSAIEQILIQTGLVMFHEDYISLTRVALQSLFSRGTCSNDHNYSLSVNSLEDRRSVLKGKNGCFLTTDEKIEMLKEWRENPTLFATPSKVMEAVAILVHEVIHSTPRFGPAVHVVKPDQWGVQDTIPILYAPASWVSGKIGNRLPYDPASTDDTFKLLDWTLAFGLTTEDGITLICPAREMLKKIHKSGGFAAGARVLRDILDATEKGKKVKNELSRLIPDCE